MTQKEHEGIATPKKPTEESTQDDLEQAPQGHVVSERLRRKRLPARHTLSDAG